MIFEDKEVLAAGHSRDGDPLDTFVYLMWHLYRYYHLILKPGFSQVQGNLMGKDRKKLGRAIRSHLGPTSQWAAKQVRFLRPKK